MSAKDLPGLGLGVMCNLESQPSMSLAERHQLLRVGGMALALALSVLGGRAKHAHAEASLTHLSVFRFKDIITEYSELQHRCPNHICVQPETKPLIPQALAAVGTAGNHGQRWAALPVCSAVRGHQSVTRAGLHHSALWGTSYLQRQGPEGRPGGWGPGG